MLQVFLEDGESFPLPAAAFFRSPEEWPDVEWAALEHCQGRVLDAGAGAGRHALALQDRGHEVVALEASRKAVDVMARLGVECPRLGDIFQFRGEAPFDTLLLLMNGLGIAGDLPGLDRFLAFAHTLVTPNGQILLDSFDPRPALDPAEKARAAIRRSQGRDVGETIQWMEYGERRSAPFPWLYVDSECLADRAGHQLWHSQVLFEDEEGSYLARLTSLA